MPAFFIQLERKRDHAYEKVRTLRGNLRLENESRMNIAGLLMTFAMPCAEY